MAVERPTHGKVLATPNDVCACGHMKIYHGWLRKEDDPPDSPVVTFANCGYVGCYCPVYEEPCVISNVVSADSPAPATPAPEPK